MNKGTEALTGKTTLNEDPVFYLELIDEHGDVIASAREVARHVPSAAEMWETAEAQVAKETAHEETAKVVPIKKATPSNKKGKT